MADLPINKPTFVARPNPVVGKKWCVELAWPAGGSEHVQDFDTESEAVAWIANKSDAWLRKRLD